MRDDGRNVRSQEEDGTYNQEDLNVTSEQFEITQNPEIHEISNNDLAKSEEEEIPDDEEDSIPVPISDRDSVPQISES